MITKIVPLKKIVRTLFTNPNLLKGDVKYDHIGCRLEYSSLIEGYEVLHKVIECDASGNTVDRLIYREVFTDMDAAFAAYDQIKLT